MERCTVKVWPAPTDRHTVVDRDIVDLASVGDVRALTEGELTELIPDDCVDAAGMLLDELAARAASTALLPLHVTAWHDDASVQIEVRWRGRAGEVAAAVDGLLAEDDEDWGVTLIRQCAESYGVDIGDDRGGVLWCRVTTL
jgi:hypothetical protein